jgi:hypothetical protein
MQNSKNCLLKIAFAVFPLILSLSIKAQPNITRLEYYVDNDPGYGKATNVSIVAANDLADIPFTINLNPLFHGVHIVGVRSRDANGAWSLDNKWLFVKPYLVPKAVAMPKIFRIEYYIDFDPGYGNGTALSIAPNTNFSNLAFNINMTPLETGVHILGVRSQDSTGAWSLDNRWLFLKSYANNSTGAAPKIERIEYYFDTDPGYGNGIAVSIVPNANFSNLALNIDMTPLKAGVHVFGIRALDSLGGWSLDNKWLFLKPYPAPKTIIAPKITRVEYYVDNDPGYGSATALSIIPNSNISNAVINIDLTPLAQGVHIVGVRSQDSVGAWSQDNRWVFLKKYNTVPAIPQPNVTNVEYYVDIDPGYGKATPVSIVPGQDLSNISFPVSLTSLGNGQHFIGIRSKDANGAWSLDNKYAFNITAPAGLLSKVHKLTMDTLVTSLKLQYNPVHQQAILLYTSPVNDRVSIRVVDNAGNVVTNRQVNVYKGVNPVTLETAALAQGIYIVQTMGAKKALSVKMLKQ